MLHYILHEMRILQANFVQSRNMKSRMNHRRYNAQAHLRSKLLTLLKLFSSAQYHLYVVFVMIICLQEPTAIKIS